jgi:hypothetical protein
MSMRTDTGRARIELARVWLATYGSRAVVAAVAGIVLLAAQPEPARVSEVGGPHGPHMRALVLSAQAQRYLALTYRSFSTEFVGCMIGETHGATVIVHRIAPADVEPRQSTPTHVIPKGTCDDAGWTGTVGTIHSHPSGERCWYFFPGTRVATSDAFAFARQPYPVDAIMCGDRVVWINRALQQQQVRLDAPEARD